MTFVQDGTTGSILQAVENGHKAARVTVRPTDALGHYSLAGFSGVIPAALGANSELVQFRNASTTLVLVKRVRISASVSTTFFAAGVPLQVDMVKATAWSAAGTGGTAPTLSATAKRRTTMPSSVIASGDIRIASTAALGAGTKTLEANSLRALAAGVPITSALNTQIIAPGTVLFDSRDGDGDYPLLLVQNEGFALRCVAVPGTGTWTFSVEIDWAEIASY